YARSYTTYAGTGVFMDMTRDPEPFRTMLSAAHGVIQAFKDQAGPEDMLALRGYGGRETDWPFQDRYANKITYPPVRAGDPAVEDFLKLTQVDDGPSGTASEARQFRVQRYFVPTAGGFTENNLYNGGSPSLAIAQAVEQLTTLPGAKR